MWYNSNTVFDKKEKIIATNTDAENVKQAKENFNRILTPKNMPG